MTDNQAVLAEFRKAQADLERSHGPQAARMLNPLGAMLVELCGPEIDNSLPVPPKPGHELPKPPPPPPEIDNDLPGRLPPRASNELPKPPAVTKPVPKPEPKKGFRR